MNPGTQKEALELFDAVREGVKEKKVEVVVCPPFVYLPLLKAKPGADLCLGAQNVSLEEKGAFTSQISAGQLKDLGVEYVIVGHSEARKYLHETDEEIAKKIVAAQAAGLQPILCIDNEKQLSFISNFKLQISNLAVAYEPLWAIGTGKSCEPKDVKKMADVIKNTVGDVKILYGGSANAENAKQYLEVVDGLLVGGASLKAEEFIKIIEIAN